MASPVECGDDVGGVGGVGGTRTRTRTRKTTPPPPWIDHRAIFDAPSGPCYLCGRTSIFPSPFRDNGFECEFPCGKPVPLDAHEQLRRLREEEERRSIAELYGYEFVVEYGNEHGYDGGDEGEANDNNNDQMEIETIHGENNDNYQHITEQQPAGSSNQDPSGNTLDHGPSKDEVIGDVLIDPDYVDIYEEMNKTMFPEGIPGWLPQPEESRSDATTKAINGDTGVQVASSNKRKRNDSDVGTPVWTTQPAESRDHATNTVTEDTNAQITSSHKRKPNDGDEGEDEGIQEERPAKKQKSGNRPCTAATTGAPGRSHDKHHRTLPGQQQNPSL